MSLEWTCDFCTHENGPDVNNYLWRDSIAESDMWYGIKSANHLAVVPKTGPNEMANNAGGECRSLLSSSTASKCVMCLSHIKYRRNSVHAV